MKLSKEIDFQNVEALLRQLRAEKPSVTRFSLEIPARDCANGLYAAFKAEVERNGGSMTLDDSTRDHILQAAEWLTNPAGTPGIMFCGLCGNGKTTLARAMQWLVGFLTERELGCSRRKNIRMVTAKQICRLCANDTKAYDALFGEEMLIIDELGEEPADLMLYGMIHTPMTDLLLERYARRRFTVITTNLKNSAIKEKYGERVYDRFREMLTIVGFNNPSYRQEGKKARRVEVG